MSSSLLDRALSGAQGQRGGRKSAGGGTGRNSPYERPAADSWKHDKFSQQQQQEENDAPRPSFSGAGAGGKGSLAQRLGAPAAAGGKEGRSNKLVIKNLHYEVSERELELLFVQIGPIATGPKIKFDRSGRSEGIAWVTYGSEAHAAQAKEAFNGAPAKGQPIEVDFDHRPDRASERGAPAPGSLLARLSGGGNDSARSSNKYAPPASSRPARGRPERGVGSGSGASRGGAGGRGGKREGGARQKREPKTNEDLDKELEAFMKQPEGSAKPTEVAAPAPAAAPAPDASAGGDVEMS
ncbi:hypothetical protein JCM6882_006921 [Rhodosporidiobolus microsporus]